MLEKKEVMAYKWLKVRVSDEVIKRYKIACIEKNLSLPKQTEQLIAKFLEIYDLNKKYIKD